MPIDINKYTIIIILYNYFMIDPTKYMPVLQCYKCYNVTTRASEREKEGSRIII